MKDPKLGPNGGNAPEASQTFDEWIRSNRPTVCIEALTKKEREYKIGIPLFNLVPSVVLLIIGLF